MQGGVFHIHLVLLFSVIHTPFALYRRVTTRWHGGPACSENRERGSRLLGNPSTSSSLSIRHEVVRKDTFLNKTPLFLIKIAPRCSEVGEFPEMEVCLDHVALTLLLHLGTSPWSHCQGSLAHPRGPCGESWLAWVLTVASEFTDVSWLSCGPSLRMGGGKLEYWLCALGWDETHIPPHKHHTHTAPHTCAPPRKHSQPYHRNTHTQAHHTTHSYTHYYKLGLSGPSMYDSLGRAVRKRARGRGRAGGPSRRVAQPRRENVEKHYYLNTPSCSHWPSLLDPAGPQIQADPQETATAWRFLCIWHFGEAKEDRAWSSGGGVMGGVRSDKTERLKEIRHGTGGPWERVTSVYILSSPADVRMLSPRFYTAFIEI